MNREDILMNPYDIYNIAVATGKSTHEVINDYTSMHLGQNSCIPILVLKKDDRQMCPFLKFYVTEGVFGCSINDHKPGNCSLHPVGIVRSLDTESLEAKTDPRFLLVNYCDYSKEANQQTKLEDIAKGYMNNLESHDLGAKIQFEFTKYVNVEKFVKAIIRNDKDYIDKHITDSTELTSLNGLHENHEKIIELMAQSFISSYLDGAYQADTDRPFLEQAEEIKERIKENAIIIITAFSTLDIDIVNPKIIKEHPEISDLIEDKTKEIKEDFSTWLQEQHQ